MSHPIKADIRRRLLSRRRHLTGPEVAGASRIACDRLRALPEWQSSRTVAVYSATHGEIDPTPLFEQAEGRTLAFPRVLPDHRTLAFHAIRDLDELIPGAFGILAPDPSGSPRIELSSIDLFVVPGVAFDGDGHRLGRGKGYYDATLSAAGRPAVRCGLAYHWQLLDSVPRHDGDVPMDLVVTDTSVLRPDRSSGTTGER